MMVATIPITTPIVVQAGYDPVWYGILVVLLMEAALLTPPVGMNLFVVQGIRERGDLNDVIIGTVPFIVTLFADDRPDRGVPGHRDVAAEPAELTNDNQRRAIMRMKRLAATAVDVRGADARRAGAGPAQASFQGADPGQPDAARQAARGAALERMDPGGLEGADHRRRRALRPGRHPGRCRAAAAEARRLRLRELRHRQGGGRRSEIRRLRSRRPDADLRRRPQGLRGLARDGRQADAAEVERQAARDRHRAAAGDLVRDRGAELRRPQGQEAARLTPRRWWTSRKASAPRRSISRSARSSRRCRTRSWTAP